MGWCFQINIILFFQMIIKTICGLKCCSLCSDVSALTMLASKQFHCMCFGNYFLYKYILHFAVWCMYINLHHIQHGTNHPFLVCFFAPNLFSVKILTFWLFRDSLDRYRVYANQVLYFYLLPQRPNTKNV